MRCPKCAEEMQTHPVGLHDVQVDECSKCGGMWLDRGELAQLSDGPRALPSSAWVNVDGERRLPCPSCAGTAGETFRESGEVSPMRTIAPADEPDLVLDRCDRCEGLWLDGGELTRVRTRQWKTPPPAEPMRLGSWLTALLRPRR
jgi:Zn-finger nucleic acid-binding protein